MASTLSALDEAAYIAAAQAYLATLTIEDFMENCPQAEQRARTVALFRLVAADRPLPSVRQRIVIANR